MTNLTEKFAALSVQLATNHGEIRTRLDEIIARLGTISATLTTNGAFDATPIVNAITGMRGNPDGIANDTLYSLNKSIWNLAGPAPGAALTDLKAILQKIVDTLGDPSTTFPQTYTVRQLLAEIKAAWTNGEGITAYNLLDSIYLALTANGVTAVEQRAILTRLILQFDTSVVYPTMKDLMLTMSSQLADVIDNVRDNQFVVPVGICESPTISTGSAFYDASIIGVSPITMATWPTTLEDANLTTDYDQMRQSQSIINCDDWTQYRVYVSSNAETFAVSARSERLPCNKWISLDISWLESLVGVQISVDGPLSLTVYICGADAPALGGCPEAAQSPLTVPSWRIWPYPGDALYPTKTSWVAASLTGGSSWANLADMLILPGSSLQPGFMVNADTPAGDEELCLSWDVDSSVERVTLTAWGSIDYNGTPLWSQIGLTGVELVMASAGRIGSTNLNYTNLHMSPYTFAEIAFIPVIVYADSHPTPPTGTITLSWLPPGWNMS